MNVRSNVSTTAAQFRPSTAARTSFMRAEAVPAASAAIARTAATGNAYIPTTRPAVL